MLPPTLLYILLPVALIESVEPVFIIWYQWASVIKWILQIKITPLYHDDHNISNIDLSFFPSPSLFIINWNGWKSLWTALFHVGPEPFFVDKRTVDFAHPLIRYLLIRLMHLTKKKNTAGQVYNIVYIARPDDIQNYFIENIPYIKRKKNPIIIINTYFNGNTCSATAIISKSIYPDTETTSIALLNILCKELTFCKIFD